MFYGDWIGSQIPRPSWHLQITPSDREADPHAFNSRQRSILCLGNDFDRLRMRRQAGTIRRFDG
jgi:hypothetical protein